MRRWTFIYMTLGVVLVSCKAPEPAAPPTPTAIPFMSDITEPTPYPDETGAPMPEGMPVTEPVTGDAAAPPANPNDPLTGMQVSPPGVSSAGGALAKSTVKTSSTPNKGQVYEPTRAQMMEAMDDYGTWYDTPQHGTVWMPRGVQADWRPYQDGHWVYTEQGWLWEAREPWGWLAYHYGGWVWDPMYGWVWVPGDSWVPSQVAWRVSDNYVAWAPVLPGPRVDISIIPPAHWVVVPAPRFLDLQLRPHIVVATRVPELIVGIPPIIVGRPAGRVVYYPGPDIVVVRRWGPVPPRPILVSTWRYEVPIRYRRHYDRGYHRGWYRPAWVAAPPPPRPAKVQVHTGPPPGYKAAAAPGHRDVEIDHRGPAGRTEVEVEHHGRGKSEVEVEHQGRHGRSTEVEVERHGRGRTEVEVERNTRHGRTAVELERRGRHVEVERETDRPKRRIEGDKHKEDKHH